MAVNGVQVPCILLLSDTGLVSFLLFSKSSSFSGAGQGLPLAIKLAVSVLKQQEEKTHRAVTVPGLRGISRPRSIWSTWEIRVPLPRCSSPMQPSPWYMAGEMGQLMPKASSSRNVWQKSCNMASPRPRRRCCLRTNTVSKTGRR